MMGYLEDFLKKEVARYSNTIVRRLPYLESRKNIAEKVRCILRENFCAAYYGEKRLIVPKEEEPLSSISFLTAKLGRDICDLLLNKSYPNSRVRQDYAIICSEIMGLFGKDKKETKEKIMEELSFLEQQKAAGIRYTPYQHMSLN